jgi:hypothetical protein
MLRLCLFSQCFGSRKFERFLLTPAPLEFGFDQALVLSFSLCGELCSTAFGGGLGLATELGVALLAFASSDGGLFGGNAFGFSLCGELCSTAFSGDFGLMPELGFVLLTFRACDRGPLGGNPIGFAFGREFLLTPALSLEALLLAQLLML